MTNCHWKAAIRRSQIVLFFLFVACAAAPRMPDPPPTHPASALAPESPLPQRPWILESLEEETPPNKDAPEKVPEAKPHQHGHHHGGKPSW